MRISTILKAPRRARRLANITRKLVSHGLGFVVTQLGIQQMLPAWIRFKGADGHVADPQEMPKQFARVLEELGPTFVKFGQMLSTRPDLLPPDYIEALTRICYSVAPFPTEVARSIVEEELGAPVDEIFGGFSESPMASGSMAQVHTARLEDGTEVVVKVRRPGIERVIDDDLAIMEYLAAQADRAEELKPFHVPMLVDEFGQGLRRELNFLAEAAHTHKFFVAFEDDRNVAVPQVYWDQTTSRVLTMERLSGVHLRRIDTIPEGERLKAPVARRILDCFLMQFFDLGVFHADPHTGNILIGASGKIALIDFGLVGRVSESLRTQLAACMIAIGSGQLDFAAEVLAEMGSVPHGADTNEFCSEVASLMERNFSIPFEKMDLQRTFLDIMGIVRKFKVIMPRDLVLMGKALVTVGAMVTELDPALNAAQLAEPYARKLAREKIAPGALGRALSVNAHHVGMLIRSAPRDIRLLLERLKTGSFDLSIKHSGFDQYLRELDKAGNRLAVSIILAAIIMSSTSMIANKVGPLIGDTSMLGLLGYGLGFVLGVVLIAGIFRSGRL